MCLIVGLGVIAFVEVGVTVLLTQHFGAWPTYSLFAIPTIIGLFLHWRRRQVMQAAWAKIEPGFKRDPYERRLLMTRPSYLEPQVELLTYWVSVFLLAIPGPLTAVIAFGLMLPFVKQAIYQKLVTAAKVQRRKLQAWKREQS